MSIETNWNFIIRKAVMEYYNSLPNGTKVTQDQVNFLDYNAMAIAVSMMKKKGDRLICGSGCKDIIRKTWQLEKDLFEKQGLAFSEQASAVKKIAEGLIATLKLANSSGTPLTIDNSNLFQDNIQTNFFGFDKPRLLQGGGTQRRQRGGDWRADWRGELTRRVSQSSRKK